MLKSVIPHNEYVEGHFSKSCTLYYFNFVTNYLSCLLGNLSYNDAIYHQMNKKNYSFKNWGERLVPPPPHQTRPCCGLTRKTKGLEDLRMHNSYIFKVWQAEAETLSN